MKVYYEKDANLGAVKSKKIAVIGYGSQGYGHSNNLKDSGCDVAVALRKDSKSWKKAEKNKCWFKSYDSSRSSYMG